MSIPCFPKVFRNKKKEKENFWRGVDVKKRWEEAELITIPIYANDNYQLKSEFYKNDFYRKGGTEDM